MKGFLAAVITLTRLPLWRIVTLDKKYYSDTLLYWPLVGYITGFFTLAAFWLASQVMPALPACIIAVVARLLVTGAMHEDGLADFFDGFGGGTTKEKILSIMKDSHIGCYGTISLIVYFLLYSSFLYTFDIEDILPIILSADVFSKWCAAITVSSLPYVRKEEESKMQILYQKIGKPVFLFITLLSLLPLCLIDDKMMLLAVIPAILTAVFLRRLMKKKIGGYTGDCCGASVLLIEQAFYLGCVMIYCW